MHALGAMSGKGHLSYTVYTDQRLYMNVKIKKQKKDVLFYTALNA